jgi:hypothetical protein
MKRRFALVHMMVGNHHLNVRKPDIIFRRNALRGFLNHVAMFLSSHLKIKTSIIDINQLLL